MKTATEHEQETRFGGPSTRYSTSVTTKWQNAIGLPTTSSTVLISSRAATGLFDLVRSLPATLKYEHDLIVAEGDYVISHGRFSGRGSPVNWIAADIVRSENGLLAEHWDVRP